MMTGNSFGDDEGVVTGGADKLDSLTFKRVSTRRSLVDDDCNRSLDEGEHVPAMNIFEDT